MVTDARFVLSSSCDRQSYSRGYDAVVVQRHKRVCRHVAVDQADVGAVRKVLLFVLHGRRHGCEYAIRHGLLLRLVVLLS